MGIKMKNRTSRVLAVTASAAMVAAMAAACGNSGSSNDSGSKSDYTIGLAAGITGPAAAIVKGEITGIQAYLDVINGKGGVDGHKLKLVTADTQNVASTAAAALTKMATSQDVVAVFGDILANNCQAQVPVAQKYKIPVMCGTLDPAQLQPPEKYAYTEYGSEVTQVDAINKVISDTLKIDKPKVALVYVKSSSTVPFFAQVADSVKKAGGEVVLDDQIAAQLDLSVDANKVKESGADVVVEQVIPQQLESLSKSLANSGSNVPIIAEATTSSYQLMSLLKDPNLYELALNPFVDPAGSESAVKDYTDSLKKTAKLSGKSDINGQSIAITYAATAFIADALKTCGSGCTSEKLNTTMEKTKLDLPGINTDYSYTSDRHYPQTKFLLYNYSSSDQDVVEVAKDLAANAIPKS